LGPRKYEVRISFSNFLLLENSNVLLHVDEEFDCDYSTLKKKIHKFGAQFA